MFKALLTWCSSKAGSKLKPILVYHLSLSSYLLSTLGSLSPFFLQVLAQVHPDSRGSRPSLETQPHSSSPTSWRLFPCYVRLHVGKTSCKGAKFCINSFWHAQWDTKKIQYMSPLFQPVVIYQVRVGCSLIDISLWRHTSNTMVTPHIYWSQQTQCRYVSTILCLSDFL